MVWRETSASVALAGRSARVAACSERVAAPSSGLRMCTLGAINDGGVDVGGTCTHPARGGTSGGNGGSGGGAATAAARRSSGSALR